MFCNLWAEHSVIVLCHLSFLLHVLPAHTDGTVFPMTLRLDGPFFAVNDPVWVPGLRIDPLRLLAGCRKRQLNQAPLNLRSLISLLMMVWSKEGTLTQLL